MRISYKNLKRYKEIATKYNLLISGGSDYHGTNKDIIQEESQETKKGKINAKRIKNHNFSYRLNSVTYNSSIFNRLP